MATGAPRRRAGTPFQLAAARDGLSRARPDGRRRHRRPARRCPGLQRDPAPRTRPRHPDGRTRCEQCAQPRATADRGAQPGGRRRTSSARPAVGRGRARTAPAPPPPPPGGRGRRRPGRVPDPHDPRRRLPGRLRLVRRDAVVPRRIGHLPPGRQRGRRGVRLGAPVRAEAHGPGPHPPQHRQQWHASARARARVTPRSRTTAVRRRRPNAACGDSRPQGSSASLRACSSRCARARPTGAVDEGATGGPGWGRCGVSGGCTPGWCPGTASARSGSSPRPRSTARARRARPAARPTPNRPPGPCRA